jgi:hypothetical protein
MLGTDYFMLGAGFQMLGANQAGKKPWQRLFSTFFAGLVLADGLTTDGHG